MATMMTEEEWTAFKKKTGKKEPQKIKTYYEENKTREEGLRHHSERAASNRKQRDDSRSTFDKLKGRFTPKEPEDQKIKTSYRPPKKIETKTPAVERPDRKGTKPPKGYNNPLANMRPDSFGFPNINPMAMGMNSPGIAGPPAWMMGMGQPEPEPAPRRRPRKKKNPQQQRQPRATTTYTDLGGIPPEVRRWMI